MVIRTILALLLMCSSAWTGNVVMLGGGVPSSCSYSQAFSYETTGYVQSLNYNYFAGSFTTTGEYTNVNRIGVQFVRLGTAPSSVHLYLYSDNGSADPGTQLASSTGWTSTYDGASTSGDLPPASVSTSNTWYYFDIPTVNLSNTTRYHVVLTKSHTDINNTIKWIAKDNGTPTEVANSGSSLPPTTNFDTSFNCNIRVITCN